MIVFFYLGENESIIEALNANITVISGQKAILTCIFSGSNQELSLSPSHQLVWIRQSHEPHNADSVLAHNQDLLISDYRLNIQRTDNDYTLTIINVNIDDEGIYACEANTLPPQRAFVHLYIQGKSIQFLVDMVLVFYSFNAQSYSEHLPYISSPMKMRSLSGNHGSGKMRVYVFNVYSSCQS